jgi:hypothetical protein
MIKYGEGRRLMLLNRLFAVAVLVIVAGGAGCSKSSSPQPRAVADNSFRRVNPAPQPVPNREATVAAPQPAEAAPSPGSTAGEEISLGELRPNRSDFSSKRPVLLNGETYVDSLAGEAVTFKVREAVYSIGRNYSRFKCQVGVIDTEPDLNAKAVFRILGDGKELYTSGAPIGIGAPQEVDIDVAGVLTLQLQASSTSGSLKIGWGNARLIK